MSKTLAERAAAMTPIEFDGIEKTYKCAASFVTEPPLHDVVESVRNLCASHEALRRQTSTECAKTLEKLEALVTAYENEPRVKNCEAFIEQLREVLRGGQA